MSVPGEDSKDGEIVKPVSYKNSRVLQLLGYFVFTVIVLADVSAIASLIIGNNRAEDT